MRSSIWNAGRSRSIARARWPLGRGLGLALSGALWLAPGPVLPVPSRSGPEGPPRPYGIVPAPGSAAAPGSPAEARAQSRALLDGPFPRGGLARGISDGTLLLASSDGARELALARIRASGASVVRIPVDWRDVALAPAPAGWSARDPAAPSYDFSRIDAAVKATAAAGLEPLLVVSHAPTFAEAPGRWAYAYLGSWAPDPAALGEFAAALARRYDGSFADPRAAAATLPRVRLLQAWNEPNLARYLEPQWVAAGRSWHAFSPPFYRRMLNAFYAGVKSVASGDRVISAGLAPNGERPGVGRMAPVTFVRELLCIGASRSPVRRSCGEPAHLDVFAFHPLSVGNPDLPAYSSLDVAISDAGKLTALLARARKQGTIAPRGAKPVWVTELNWESAPAAAGGVPAALQAGWISRALHRLWVAGVTLAQWQFLIDPFPALRASTPTGGLLEYSRPAGLYRAAADGDPAAATPKPFLQGFTLPFDPLRRDRRTVRVWALLSAPGATAVLQRRRGATWSTVASLRADAHGVLNALVQLRGAAVLRLAAGALTSAAASVPTGRSRM